MNIPAFLTEKLTAQVGEETAGAFLRVLRRNERRPCA